MTSASRVLAICPCGGKISVEFTREKQLCGGMEISCLLEVPSTAKINRLKKVLEIGNFTLSSGRLRQRIGLRCVPHVQHDYISSFNQSDRCFLASSLTSTFKSPLLTYILRLSHLYQRKLILLQIQCFTRLTSHQLFSSADTEDLD